MTSAADVKLTTTVAEVPASCAAAPSRSCLNVRSHGRTDPGLKALKQRGPVPHRRAEQGPPGPGQQHGSAGCHVRRSARASVPGGRRLRRPRRRREGQSTGRPFHRAVRRRYPELVRPAAARRRGRRSAGRVPEGAGPGQRPPDPRGRPPAGAARHGHDADAGLLPRPRAVRGPRRRQPLLPAAQRLALPADARPHDGGGNGAARPGQAGRRGPPRLPARRHQRGRWLRPRRPGRDAQARPGGRRLPAALLRRPHRDGPGYGDPQCPRHGAARPGRGVRPAGGAGQREGRQG